LFVDFGEESISISIYGVLLIYSNNLIVVWKSPLPCWKNVTYNPHHSHQNSTTPPLTQLNSLHHTHQPTLICNLRLQDCWRPGRLDNPAKTLPPPTLPALPTFHVFHTFSSISRSPHSHSHSHSHKYIHLLVQHLQTYPDIPTIQRLPYNQARVSQVPPNLASIIA